MVGQTGSWQKITPGMLPRFKETFGLVRKDQMGSMQWIKPKHDTSMFGLMTRESKTWGPPETAAPEIKEIWRNALKETEAKYPIGHPLLVAEAKHASVSQEETQKMIAHGIYLERRRLLLGKWSREYGLEEELRVRDKEPEVLKRYPLGEVPEQIEEITKVPETPMPILKGAPMPAKPTERQPSTLPVNAARRTSAQYDGIVRHLGYEPVDSSDTNLPTDIQIIEDSQRRLSKVRVIPEHELTESQKAHLLLAKEISSDISPGIKKIQTADIPPASEHVRTAGLYGRSTREIFISLDQLNRGQATIHTTVHELAHDTSGAEDTEETHNLEMARIAGKVVSMTAERRFDKFIATPGFQW